VRVISKTKLRAFWNKHPQSEDSLNAWYRVAEQAEWSNPNEVRDSYRSADPVGAEFVVFDICNNHYRLVVRVDYARSIVYVWDVYTHADYDRLDLKAIDDKIRRDRKKSQTDRRH
jgi:mRNA interferase HigB